MVRALESEPMPANSKIAAIDSEIGALIRKRRVASGLTLQAWPSRSAALTSNFLSTRKVRTG